MKHALLALALVSFQAKPAELDEEDRLRFLAGAVFEGLLEDQAEPNDFRLILSDRDKHFVIKCPICNSVAGAIDGYLAFRGSCLYHYRGKGFPADLTKGLKSLDRAARLKAIEAMVDRYVARGFERSTMTEAEKAKMKELLSEGKRFGMSVKEKTFGDFCPSCAGATKK